MTDGPATAPAGTPYGAVVLYFRRGEEILRTLADLQGQEHPPAQIVLVDNASGDGVLDSLKAELGGVEVLTLAENRGYAGGMNAGYDRIRRELRWVLFMTHEVRLAAACLDEMFAATRSGTDRAMVAVGPQLRLADSDVVWSAGGTISRGGNVGHLTESGPAGAVSDVDWLDGACVLVERRAFEQIDGFDEDYFLYWEDVDLSARLRGVGRIGVATAAVAHQSTATTPIYFMTRNRILYWRKRKAPLRAALAIGRPLAIWLLRDRISSRNTRPEQGRARLLGIGHGLSKKISLEFAGVREQ
ncbi:glycosyltransferase family 2 protein [Nakamurella silvestris]|nr:glycosyltransferase family 2 protein [Nakamurella silvestris]